jgi:hypothetical protein
MLHVRRLWIEGDVGQRQRFQKLLFPKGVTYDPESGSGTAETAVFFRWLAAVRSGASREASPTVPSWNQLRDCLRQLDILRKTLAA